MPDINNKITIEDIENLLIEKKFVRIESDRYTDEAYEFVRQLIDQEHAILFDKSKHRIYTLGDYYGGDVFKENLYYYSKIKHVDVDDNILQEIEAISPESELSLETKEGIDLKFEDNKIKFGINLQDLIDQSNKSNYKIIVNDNNKLEIVLYHTPEFSITPIDFNNQETITLDYNIDSVINENSWEYLELESENCEILNFDKETKKIELQIDPNNYINGINEKLIFKYNDTQNEDIFIIDNIYNIEISYGIYNTNYSNYSEYGKISLNKLFDSIIQITQKPNELAYIRIPKNINNIIFFDTIRCIQGAWRKKEIKTINRKEYQIYCTDNDNLGKISWKIIKNI